MALSPLLLAERRRRGVCIKDESVLDRPLALCRGSGAALANPTPAKPLTASTYQPENLGPVKGKCALGPFLSILVIECQHKCLNVNLCPWMNKVQIKSKGMFLSLSTLVLCTNILV
jgi:hypothetical protein